MSTEKKDKSKTLQLTVVDRISIPRILPEKGGLVDQIIARDIRKKVDFTQQDITRFELQDVSTNDGMMAFKWNPKKDKPTPITFTDEEMRLLIKSISLLDKQKMITPSNIDTVLKIKNA